MTLTYREALEFSKLAQDYLNKVGQTPSALTWALSKNLKSLKPSLDDYQDKLAELERKYQEKDKDGNFLFHKGTQIPRFTDKDHKEFREQFRKLQSEEFEFTPYHATQVPASLEAIWYEYFYPIAIKEYPNAD